jgi:tartrate dehydrogenase/decarboxylase / D-malate dehydrogenase
VKSYRIASIPGDGIGNEVIPAGMDVLAALAAKEGFDLKFEAFDWGSERYKKTGRYIPEGGLAKLKGFDAILFGAVGAPDVPDHMTTSRSGACACRSARASTSTPTSGLAASFPE